MIGKILYNIVSKEARKNELRIGGIAGPQDPVSRKEFEELEQKFKDLCNYLEVSVTKPWGYEVKKHGQIREVSPEEQK